MARQLPAADPTGKAIPVVEFQLGKEHYAVNLTDYINLPVCIVRVIIAARGITASLK
ncbi:MAG: hypothetical protein Q8S57_04280 [Methanoregula sp.]|nr:hypothetical protein [Methanoregula sp.]